MSRPTAAARSSRILLTGYFLGLGVVMAIWGARMPAVQHATHLSTAQLSWFCSPPPSAWSPACEPVAVSPGPGGSPCS